MMKIDHNSPESPYQKLQRELGEIIGNAKPGDKLPTEPALAKALGVSRSTLREAMRSFETQGLLIRKQGAGTFRADASGIFDSGLEVLESLETLSIKLGLTISMGDLSIEHLNEDDVLYKKFESHTTEKLMRISRAILVKGQPAAFLIDIVPEHVLSPKDLEEGFKGSVLDLLIQRGNPMPDQSRTQIKVLPAPREVARALDIQRGESLLLLEADLVDKSGKIIDHSYSWFLPGYFHFHFNRKIGII